MIKGKIDFEKLGKADKEVAILYIVFMIFILIMIFLNVFTALVWAHYKDQKWLSHKYDPEGKGLLSTI